MTTDHAARAHSFGADPDRYDQVRPGYPIQLVDDLIGDIPARVLDVGCGTGIAARGFLDRQCSVHGVEHDARMAAVARRNGLTVDVGKFEEWTPPRESLDLVISGQAWHWIDRDLGTRKAADILRPEGQLAIFWVEYEHTAPTAATFEASYRQIAPELLNSSHPLGRSHADGHSLQDEFLSAIADSLRFEQPTMRQYATPRSYTTEQWLDELFTHSDHRLLPAQTRDDLTRSLTDHLARAGGTITVTLRTRLIAARKSTE